MSATSDSARDPRMLPGISAFDWSRAVAVTYLFYFLVAGVFFLGLATRRGSFPISDFLIPFGAVVGVTLITQLGTALRSRAEARAGYTTLGGSPNLDQLDRRSGVLIRRAGEPLLRSRNVVATLRGEQGVRPARREGGAPAFPPRTPSATGLAIFVRGGPIVVGIAVLTFRAQSAQGAGLVPTLVIVALFAVAIVVSLAAVRASLGRRIQSVAAVRPKTMIFTSSRSADVAVAILLLGGGETKTTGRLVVSVSDTALELWAADASSPVLSVPWAEVLTIAPGQTTISRNSFLAIETSVVRGETRVLLPLAIYGRHGIAAATSEWANVVFDEIEHHAS